MKKEYFYTDDSGKMQKYIYCIRGCEQPYKKTQIGIDISKVSDHSYVCKKCAKELALKCELTNQVLPDIFDMEVIDIVKSPDDVENVLVKEAIINEFEDIKKDIKSNIKENVDVEEKSCFYAYVLKCNDGTYFCSVTTCEVEKAVKNHNSGKMSSYTKERRPVVLEKSEQVNSLDEAKKIKADYEKIYKN